MTLLGREASLIRFGESGLLTSSLTGVRETMASLDYTSPGFVSGEGRVYGTFLMMALTVREWVVEERTRLFNSKVIYNLRSEARLS